MRRRDFLRVTAAGSALLGVPGLTVGCGEGGGSIPKDPLEVAKAVGAWLQATARVTRGGLTWPLVPAEGDAAAVNLYSGTPGVILFFLELYHATGDPSYLQVVMDGAYILQGAYTEGGSWPAAAGITPEDPSIRTPGLYTGWTGAAFTLGEIVRTVGDEMSLMGANVLFNGVVQTAQVHEEGVAWYEDNPQNASYDIISGSSGMGLGLLYAHEVLGVEPALDIAEDAGRYLMAKGRPQEVGVKWPMSETYERLMPNFSHGTAGVAYFLARLAEVTGDEQFLDSAIQGARYLQAVSKCEADGCLVFHHEPDGEDLFYLGWCHGPTGTARLYHQLAKVTGESEWSDWVLRGAKGIRDQGIPDTRTEGFWNNVSQCCGDAGVGDFFLSLAAETGDDTHADFARQFGAYILGEASGEDGGVYWTQAENRTQPEFVQAQTGWMQGAAGAGAFFLHLDAYAKGRAPRIRFLDSPWSA